MSTPWTEQRVQGDVDAKLARIERLLGSDPGAADRAASEFLQQAPGHEAALLLQGIARRLTGNPAGAVEVLESLAARSPNVPIVHLQLGLALRETRQDRAAAAALQRAVSIRPDYATGWLALAELLTATEDAQGADRAFSMYVKHSAQDLQLQSASAALRERRIPDAIAILNRLLAKHPNDVVALCLMADAAKDDRRVADAEMLLARCLRLAPGYHAARHNYAVILMRQDKLAEALREIDRLILVEPGNPVYRNLKAAIHARLGEYGRAIEIYQHLLDEFPGQPSSWTNLGHVLRTVGRREECIAAYRKAITLAPDMGEAYWNLANLKTLQINDADLESMRKQLQKPSLPDEDRLHFHFAIGKALEDRKEYAESFRNYAEGNRIRRQSVRHAPENMEDHVRRCKALFTPGFYAERRDYGADNSDPIFIVGLPRVGSTLVEQILACHSAVEGTKELANLTSIAMSLGPLNTGLSEDRYPELFAHLGRDACTELGRRYVEQTRPQRRHGTPFFIDKMPNNFTHVGIIHLLLPKARIIDVRRHPMACGWSLFKHLFAQGQYFSYSFEEIAARYRCYVELMAHFDAVLPGRVHRIFYESLVSDTEAEIRRLLDYCGLPFEEACLNFHESRRAVNTPSSEQVRSPIFREAVNQWRNYEPFLAPLRAALGPLVDAYPGVPEC